MDEYDPAPNPPLPNIHLTERDPEFILWQGSESSLMLRRRDDENDPPDPGDRDDPPPGPALILPDVAFKALFADEMFDTVVAQVVPGLQRQFGAQADIRPLRTERKIGIWVEPMTSANDAARGNGLKALALDVPAGNLIVIFINAGYVRRDANALFAMRPHRLDTDGNPDPAGSVHLSRQRVTFAAPSTVKTIVSGWIDTVPDVDFTFTITDVLELSPEPPGVRAKTSTHFEPETSIIISIASWVAVFAGLVASAFVGPLGAGIAAGLIAGAGLGLAGYLEFKSGPDFEGGAGATAVMRLPFEAMIQGGKKIVFPYNKVFVTAAGIQAAAVPQTQDRTPFAWLSGPASVVLLGGETRITLAFAVSTDDLRAPLRTEWLTGTPESQVFTERVVRAKISLPVPRTLPATRTVRVRVIDADGLQAEASHRLRFAVQRDDPSPQCIAKPWMEGCQPF